MGPVFDRVFETPAQRFIKFLLHISTDFCRKFNLFLSFEFLFGTNFFFSLGKKYFLLEIFEKLLLSILFRQKRKKEMFRSLQIYWMQGVLDMWWWSLVQGWRYLSYNFCYMLTQSNPLPCQESHTLVGVITLLNQLIIGLWGPFK